MTLEQLAQLGEFASGLGVVATITYAFFEYRGRRRDSEMQAAYDGEVGWSEFNMQIASDPAFAHLCMRAFSPTACLADFTSPEQAQLDALGRALFHRLEAQWYVSQRRGLPPDIWRKRRAWARATIEHPIGRWQWEHEKAAKNLTSDFIREIETAPLEATLPFGDYATGAD